MIVFSEATQGRIAVLTESQAFNVLLEAASLSDIYDKYYKDIPMDVYDEIVTHGDPTYNPNKPEKMGIYSKWLLQQYRNGTLKTEDLYKAKQYLAAFDKYKAQIGVRDIGQYRSLPQLYDAVGGYIENPGQSVSKSEQIRNVKKNEAEKVYEDGRWLVVVPNTQEAACYYGKGTQWCTAATGSSNYFNYYNEQGPLFINIDKANNRKYQFHFETEQFMDERDDDIDTPIEDEIGLTPELTRWYAERYKDMALPIFSNYRAGELVRITGDIYVDDDERNILRLDAENGELNTLYSAGYDGWIAYEPLWSRYLRITSAGHYTELFDLQTLSPVFGDESMVERFDTLGQGRLLVYEYTDGYEGTNARIYSLDERRFVYDIPEGYIVKNMAFQTRNFGAQYDDALAIMTDPNGMLALFNTKTCKPMTEFKYKRVSSNSIAMDGKFYHFLTLLKDGDNYYTADTVLYDGTVVPYGQLAQNGDLLKRHLFLGWNT